MSNGCQVTAVSWMSEVISHINIRCQLSNSCLMDARCQLSNIYLSDVKCIFDRCQMKTVKRFLEGSYQMAAVEWYQMKSVNQFRCHVTVFLLPHNILYLVVIILLSYIFWNLKINAIVRYIQVYIYHQRKKYETRSSKLKILKF